MKENTLYEDPLASDLAERYLQHRLTPEQEAEFEEYLLENPAAALAVEDAQRLRSGLEGLAAENVVEKFRRPAAFRRYALPLAASLLLAVALFALWRSQSQLISLEQQLAAAKSPHSASILTLSPLRGGAGEEAGPVLTLGPPDELFVFSLETTDPGAERYEVELRGSGGRVLWRSAALRAGADGRLVISLSAGFLPPGAVEFVAESRREGGPPRPAGRFGLQVEAPGKGSSGQTTGG